MLSCTRDGECAYYVASVDRILPNPCRVTALDLDHTLIAPRGGRKLPKDNFDWAWKVDLEKLRQKCEGSNVVIFSNQAGLKTQEQITAFMSEKILAIVKDLLRAGIGASVFVAIGRSRYRKPKTAMWDVYCHATGVSPKSGGVLVGDAAGRPGDFSDCDRKMAFNLCFQFRTPEVFMDQVAESKLPPLQDSPYALAQASSPAPGEHVEEFKFLPPGYLEVILLCGSPGSGKSSFRRRAPPHYKFVCQDDEHTKAKCLSGMTAFLKAGHPVIVDNTNRDKKTRKEYLDRMNKLNIPGLRAHPITARCIYLETSKELVRHLDALRLDHPIPAESKIKRLPEVAINSFFKNFEMPTVDEGFAQVFVQKFRYRPDVTPIEHFGRWHVESKPVQAPRARSSMRPHGRASPLALSPIAAALPPLPPGQAGIGPPLPPGMAGASIGPPPGLFEVPRTFRPEGTTPTPLPYEPSQMPSSST